MAVDPSGAGTPAPAGDPSMEDILASIRRILNEDEQQAAASTEAAGEATPPRAPSIAAVPNGPAPAAEPEPLTLSEAMLVPEPPPPRPAPASTPVEGLLAATTAAAAAASVGELRRAFALDRVTATHRGGPTIEDLVREELRPLLKGWLDSHLPPLVERLVRAELARVAQGGD